MSQTTINGATQIKSGTVPWAAMATGAIVPTASLVAGALFIQSGGSVAMAASLNMGTNTIQNVSTPVNANDAASKAYVDATVNGFTIHGARVVAVANVTTLSGLPTTDGVTLTDSQIELLTAQTTQSQNGPWAVHSGAWTRPSWWASAAVIEEGNYFILDPDGTTYKNTKWFVTNTGNVTVDTTAVTFTQDSSGTSYSNGTGLSLTGTVFAVLYGTTSTTACVGNDARIPTSLGTGVDTALGISVNTGSGLAVLSSGVLAAAQVPAYTGGDVTSAGGSLTLTVNNTSGSGFVKYGDFIFNETPSGTVNGSNATFTLANAPASSGVDLELCLNGVCLEPGSGNDFTISGTTITMLLVPQTGDKLRAYYMK